MGALVSVVLAIVCGHFQGYCDLCPELPWIFHVIMDALASLVYPSVKFSEGHLGHMAVEGTFVDNEQKIALLLPPASQCAISQTYWDIFLYVSSIPFSKDYRGVWFY